MARYRILDVFTDRPLAGNQLAVFADGPSISEELLHPIAREVAFSETVFAFPPASGGDVRIRIFTPGAEIRFAGHPVLGSAVALADDRDEVRVETGSGIVPVRLHREAGRAFGWMTQPIPSVTPYERTDELLAALRVGRSELPVERYDNGMQHVYVTLPDPGAVAALEPDYGAIARLLPGVGTNTIAGHGRHWKTRMFDPGEGIFEDPATGSAAGPLAVHLVRHGRIRFGEEIEISQGAEIHRPSTLYARAEGSADAVTRVEVGGWVVPLGWAELDL